MKLATLNYIYGLIQQEESAAEQAVNAAYKALEAAESNGSKASDEKFAASEALNRHTKAMAARRDFESQSW